MYTLEPPEIDKDVQANCSQYLNRMYTCEYGHHYEYMSWYTLINEYGTVRDNKSLKFKLDMDLLICIL